MKIKNKINLKEIVTVRGKEIIPERDSTHQIKNGTCIPFMKVMMKHMFWNGVLRN